MRRLARLTFVAAVVVVACATRNGITKPLLVPKSPSLELAVWPPDSAVVVELAPMARAQVDTVIAETRASRIEQAWCVSEYSIRPAFGRRLIAIARLERSPNVARADSVTIWSHRQLCDDPAAPSLHSHVIWAGGWLFFPSPTDLATAASRDAPFELLVSCGDDRVHRLTVYALRAR